MGEKDHSKMQTRLTVALANREGLHVWTEQRVQVKATRFRVPDICVTIGEPGLPAEKPSSRLKPLRTEGKPEVTLEVARLFD